MPLQLPNLDDRTYADLMEEARRLIPTYAPEWTNHNPSDPGIALIELFAYLSEILLYRLNRVTEANQLAFLKLLRGPDWTPSGQMEADTRAVVQRVRESFRAVTAADYERLAVTDFNQLLWAMRRAENATPPEPIEDWWSATLLDRGQDNQPSKVPPVKRARCVPVRNLERGTEQGRTQSEPGHVSLVIVSDTEDPLHPPKLLREAVWGFLDERRMLTTRHHVVGPSYAPIGLELVIARTDDAKEKELRSRIINKLGGFLHPLRGGAEEKGWPFGRDVYVSELCEQLEAIPGIDYVTDMLLVSTCEGGEDRCVPASQIWHAEGDLIGLKLAQHHLPDARVAPTNLPDPSPLVDPTLIDSDLIGPGSINPAKIVIVPRTKFVPVRLTVMMENTVSDVASIKQQLKSAIRTFLHPLSRPKPQDKVLRLNTLLAILGPIATPAQLSVTLEVDSTHERREGGALVGFSVEDDEVVNWSVVVKLSDT